MASRALPMLRVGVLAILAFAAFPTLARAVHTFDGDIMVGNARGGSMSVAGVPPTIADGYEVGGLVSGDVVRMIFPCPAIRAHATQSGSQVASCLGNYVEITSSGATVVFFPATFGLATGLPDTRISVNGLIEHAIRYTSVDLICEPAGPGRVTAFDFNRFRQSFLGNTSDPACDFLSDGAVDAFDFNLFRREYLCSGPGVVCEQTQCDCPANCPPPSLAR